MKQLALIILVCISSMMWNQTNAQCPSQELHATNAGENNEFGWPVAIDGDYLVIGSGLEGENSNRTGAAYVFQKIKDMWVEIKKLTASDGANADNFGTAVAINDETIIVGARSHDPAGIDSAGAAYVFERNYGGVNNWGQAKKLVASSQSDDAFFGFAVDIHDDTIVVGATRAFSGDGAAFAFDRNFGGDENWGETAVLFSTGREHGYRTDDVGRKVSVYGNIIIVSELYMPDNSTITGAVTVFRRVNEPAGWIEIKRLTAEPFQDDDDYAKTIDIVEETIIVGSAGRDDRGTVFMYKRNLGGVDAWGEYGTIYPSDGEITDAFGRVVSLGTDRIMVQAPSDQNNEGPDGSAYIFRRDFDSGNEQWNESVKLLFNDAAEGESWSIKGAMSSNSIVFGNPVDDDFGYNSGSAYVYRLNYVEVLPTIIERLRGIGVRGEIQDVHTVDNSYHVTRPDVFHASNTPPVQIELVGYSPTIFPSEIRFRMHDYATVDNIYRWIWLYNYQTNEYVLVDDRLAKTADYGTEVTICDRTLDFVDMNTGEVRALIQYNATAFSIVPTWSAWIDKSVWNVLE